MIHSFDIDDAIKYGMLEAALLYNIRFWVAKNEANAKHFYKGRTWTYNSARAFAKLFPYASQQTIQRALKRLEAAGALLSDHFNENPYDQTKWYALTDSSKMINVKIQNDQSSNNTDIKPVIKERNVYSERFEEFWKLYPKKDGKLAASKAFEKLKPDDQLLKEMIDGVTAYQTCKKVQSGYVKDGVNWINERRWEDEVEQPMSAYEKMMRL